MGFEIEYDPDVLRDLKKIDRPVQQRLIGFQKQRVARLENSRDLGEAIAGAKLGGYWKYRVGDWCIIFDIQDRHIVFRVLRIGNRRDVYR